MDDGTLGGSQSDVIDDLKMIEEDAGVLGLQLNRKKSEFICPDPTTRGCVLSSFPGLHIVNMEDTTTSW